MSSTYASATYATAIYANEARTNGNGNTYPTGTYLTATYATDDARINRIIKPVDAETIDNGTQADSPNHLSGAAISAPLAFST